MFDTIKKLFGGANFSIAQIESYYEEKLGQMPSNNTLYKGNEFLKENPDSSLEDITLYMLKHDLKEIIYNEFNFTPSNESIDSTIFHYKQHKSTLKDLINFNLELNKKELYKTKFISKFKEKYKRNPSPTELKKANEKINSNYNVYNSYHSDNFINTLLTLFIASEVLSDNSVASDLDSFISDNLTSSGSAVYSESSSDKSSSTSISDSSGSGSGCSGSGSGSGSGCSGSGSGSGSGCSGSGCGGS